MTDPTAPTDDELSLALDGEADAELQARIDASPDAQARLEELRAAAALVASPVAALDPNTVDDLVSTAIDTPVAPSRGRSTAGKGATPWIVAAAVILLMATGLSLVWAGRGSDDDQASASRTADANAQTADDESAGADSSFSEAGGAGGATDGSTEMGLPGGHGSPTTIASSPSDDLIVSYLGSFPSADALREATATSFADAFAASGGTASYDSSPLTSGDAEEALPAAPSAASVDRCAQQLQVTLKLDAGPVQAGYATVDGKDVIAYEFGATSARDGEETTLVAAVGTEACDEVVFFER